MRIREGFSSSRLVVDVLSSLMILFILVPLIALYINIKLNIIKNFIENNMYEREILNALGVSLEASFAAVLLLVVFGTPLAYALAKKEFPGKSLIESLVDIPLVMPHAVAGIMILAAYGKEGLLGGVLNSIGLRIEDAFPGIVAVMAFVSAPLLIDTVKVGFQEIDESLIAVARSLGASNSYVARTIILPLVWRSLLAGSLLAWARGLSEVGALLIVAYYPKTINILILEYFTVYGYYYAVTLSALYSLLIIFIFIFIRRLSRNE